MTRGYTVELLAWDDVAIGGIDLPKARLEMVWGFGSGLARRPSDAAETVWAIGDRGPNFKVEVAVERYGMEGLARHAGESKAKVMPRLDIGPALAELRVEDDRVALVRILPLTGEDGATLTGLPPPGSEQALVEPALDLCGDLIAPDPSGADTEGLIALPDGGFIVGDEYGPSLLRLDAQARVIERWVPEGSGAAFDGARYPVRDVLPALAARRRLNRGFEALSLSPDGARLALAFQSPLAHPDAKASKKARHVRLWVLDLATGALLAEHLYPLDKPKAFRRDPDAKRDDIKVSELVWLADGSLLVLERVSQSTKFYRITLDVAAPANGVDPSTHPTIEERSAAEEPLPELAKTLVLDTDDAPEIGADLEGMAVLGPDELLLINDNDFGCEGAVTGFWRVRFDRAVFSLRGALNEAMRVLVTGSSGWLGRFLVPALQAAGHDAIGLDVAPGPQTRLVGSVADRGLIVRTFAEHRIDGVIHAAALHKPDIARYGRQAFVDVNVTGTLNLLETAVAAGVSRFVFTSTTSLMISHAIREGRSGEAVWIDETLSPLVPRNIYGVTKLSAERLCRLIHDEHALPVLVLRTARFFPEEDDTYRALPGENMKANELLHRRLTVADAVTAHVAALERVPAIGFDTLILSAPTPFARGDAAALKADAAAVIARAFPDAPALYAARGWRLPESIDRVYDATRAERVLGFRCRTDFAAVLAAMRRGDPFPVEHDAAYVSPALGFGDTIG